MRLGLVQSQHNAMYDFLSQKFPFTESECLAMQRQQFEQNLHLLDSAAGQGYDLLVTTECINYIRTGLHNLPEYTRFYPCLDGEEVRTLSNAARRAGSWLVAGLGFRENGQTFNGALIFDRRGELHSIYRKIHLAGDESFVFTPGQDFCVVDADFGRFGVCICWDMQYPETARILSLRGAQLIVCPTWGWEADLYGRARAYENGVFAAAAMAVPAWGPIESPRTPSSVVTPEGVVAACGPTNSPALVCCDISLPSAGPYHPIRLDSRRPELYTDLTAPLP